MLCKPHTCSLVSKLLYHLRKYLVPVEYPFPIPLSHFSNFQSAFWASLMVQMVKNLPAVQETWVRSLGW